MNDSAIEPLISQLRGIAALFFDGSDSLSMGDEVVRKTFSLDEEIRFDVEAEDAIHQSISMVLSGSEVRQLKFVIGELYTNACHHSESSTGVLLRVCRSADTRIVRFCLIDFGIGFQRKIAQLLGRSMSDEESIVWAVEDGNSVRYLEQGFKGPGGVGLQDVCDYVSSCDGQFVIGSGTGFFKFDNKGSEHGTFEQSFPGTFVGVAVDVGKIRPQIPTSVSVESYTESMKDGSQN